MSEDGSKPVPDGSEPRPGKSNARKTTQKKSLPKLTREHWTVIALSILTAELGIRAALGTWKRVAAAHLIIGLIVVVALAVWAALLRNKKTSSTRPGAGGGRGPLGGLLRKGRPEEPGKGRDKRKGKEGSAKEEPAKEEPAKEEPAKEATREESVMTEPSSDSIKPKGASLHAWGNTLRDIAPAIEELKRCAQQLETELEARLGEIVQLIMLGETEQVRDTRNAVAQLQAIAADLRQLSARPASQQLARTAGKAEILHRTFLRDCASDVDRLEGRRGTRRQERNADVRSAEQDI